MKRVIVAMMVAASGVAGGAACGPPRVEVGAPGPAAGAGQLKVKHTLGQRINA